MKSKEIKITKEFLEAPDAYENCLMWWLENCQGLSDKEQLLNIAKHNLEWFNWVVVKLMTHKQRVKYSIFTAELVIDIFEKEYPEDKRPREAIEAAKMFIESPIEENKQTTMDTARGARDAADDAWDEDAALYAAQGMWAVYNAANAAVRAVYDAAYAAYAASKTAIDASWGVRAAAVTAWEAAYDADNKIKSKIIGYAIKKALEEN